MIYKNYTCILPNFLSVEEVSYIHGYAQQIDTMNSRVGGGAVTKDADSYEESGGEDHAIRQSTNKWIDHNDLNFDQKIKQKIFDGMVQANQTSGWNYDIADMDHWQYTVYEAQPNRKKGDFYTWHTDAGVDPYPSGQIRKISCSVQLSVPEDYEGGHFQWIESAGTFDRLRQGQKTIYTDDLVHTAPMSGREIGSLIVFPSWLHHQVTPVTRGVRKSLVVWNTGWPLR